MDNIAVFIINSILLGIGLAMDAFSVSIANGIRFNDIQKKKTFIMVLTFAGFQFIMPLIGWFCVHLAAERFQIFADIVPWIAFGILLALGINMIVSSLKKSGIEDVPTNLNFKTLLIQGIATSIDALSVGFTISNYSTLSAVVCSLIIAAVTFTICLTGTYIGKKVGLLLANKATLIGGIILIGVGSEILITSFF